MATVDRHEARPLDVPTVGSLRRDRHFDEAFARLNGAWRSGPPLEPVVERAVAELMSECGRDEAASTICDTLAKEGDVWGQARFHELRVILGRGDCAAALHDLGQMTSNASLPDRERAIVNLVQARILRRAFDSTGEPALLDQASEQLESARGCAPKAAWVLPECATLARIKVGLASDYAEAVDQALVDVAALQSDCHKMPVEDYQEVDPLHDPSRELLFEIGRLFLLARKLDVATEAFDAVLTGDDRHQRAYVWRIYARRLAATSIADLVAQHKDIDDLLDHSLSREMVQQDHHTGTPDQADPYSTVCHPKLAARLLAERGGILEASDPSEALRNYDMALRLHGNMAFAQRGRLRCLMASDQSPNRAAELAGELLQLAEDSKNQTTKAELFVEVGRFDLAQRRFRRAWTCFERAIEQLPGYGYAHERKLVALRLEGRHKAARREAERLLATKEALRDDGGVRIELGIVMLELGDTDKAIELFGDCKDSQVGAIRDRARAGLIHAHRFARNYQAAEDVLAEAQSEPEGSTPGFRVWEAAGWLAGDLGDFSGALSRFELGLEQRPHEEALVADRAMALRRLGRTSEAASMLRRKQAVMGMHGAGLDTAIGWAELDCEHPDEALVYFKRACKRNRREDAALRGYVAASARMWSFAESHRQQARELRTQLEPAEVARGAFLTELGRWCALHGALGDAADLFREANETPTSKSGATRVNQLLVQGDSYLVASDFASAETAIRQLESLEEGRYAMDPNVRLLRASWHLARSQTAEAQTIFAEVRGAYRRSHAARVGCAAVASHRADLAGVIRELEDLVEIHPTSAVAQELLLRAQIDAAPRPTKDEGDAEGDRLASECVTLLDAEPCRPQASIALAVLGVTRGDLAQAQLHMRRAATIAPGQLEPVREVAWVALLTSDWKTASAALKAAENIDPHDRRLQLLRGVYHLELNESTNAVHALRRACALDPGSPQAHSALASALHDAGESSQAMLALADALVKVPDPQQGSVYLCRARIRYEWAAGETRQTKRDLLAGAVEDANGALARMGRPGARSPGEEADAHYYLGMIRHAQGAHRQSKKHVDDCLKISPDHARALSAKATMDLTADTEPDERHTRRWANVLGVAALILLAAVLVGAIARDAGPTTYVTAGGILLLALAATAQMPRLTGFKLGGIGSISVVPIEAHELSPPEPSFRRLPREMLSGPGASLPSQLTPDMAGPSL